ncbi:MAG: hypothetical protein IPJ07_13830 [Acidobacteria bacterium]|nr:hypothetical protein [Acidobacteriota bacterium]
MKKLALLLSLLICLGLVAGAKQTGDKNENHSKEAESKTALKKLRRPGGHTFHLRIRTLGELGNIADDAVASIERGGGGPRGEGKESGWQTQPTVRKEIGGWRQVSAH